MQQSSGCATGRSLANIQFSILVRETGLLKLCTAFLSYVRTPLTVCFRGIKRGRILFVADSAMSGTHRQPHVRQFALGKCCSTVLLGMWGGVG